MVNAELSVLRSNPAVLVWPVNTVILGQLQCLSLSWFLGFDDSVTLHKYGCACLRDLIKYPLLIKKGEEKKPVPGS